jgi:hypothetical protein
MAREAGLGADILALCDERCRELKAREQRLNAECVARLQSKALPSRGQPHAEAAPMIESHKPARAAG